MKVAIRFLVATMVFTGYASQGFAQAESSAVRPATVQNPTQTLYLSNATTMVDSSEILTAMRNILPAGDKIYLVPTQNAIVMSASQADILMAQKILADLDRPRKTYRLTYTITEVDGQRRIGTQHFAMVLVSGQKTTMKQGNRVPVITGTYNPGSSSAQNQVTYIDVGLNFEATLDESASGVRLRTKAEQSSVADDKPAFGSTDPVVRQTLLEGTAILTPGKPLMLGSLDVPGSTRHLDIDVMMEVVR